MNIKYDWDWILDGSPHTMCRVHPDSTAPLKRDEFDTNEMSFRNNASQAAIKRGLRATLWSNKGTRLVVQAYDPKIRKAPKLGWDNFDQDRAKTPTPNERLCTVCGYSLNDFEIQASENETGVRQCWILGGEYNIDPIGPKHK